MTDRTTKLLLAAIAAGLWANAVVPLVRSAPASAQMGADGLLSNIESSVAKIARGSCANSKIC
jgi:hypothetical protein